MHIFISMVVQLDFPPKHFLKMNDTLKYVYFYQDKVLYVCLFPSSLKVTYNMQLINVQKQSCKDKSNIV